MFRLENTTKKLEREKWTLELKLVWTIILVARVGLFLVDPTSIE